MGWSVLVGSTPLCLPWAHCRMSEGELYSTVGLCVQAKLLQSCPTLCNPMDCGLPGSSVRGILQARIIEWAAMPSSRGSSQPRDWTHVSCFGRQVLYHFGQCKFWLQKMRSAAVFHRSKFSSSVQFSSVTQSCPTPCDPTNCSTPGLPVHHQLPEFIQTHVHRVGDAIQPSHPLSSPSPPAPNPSQHQSLFQWVHSLHEVAYVLEFQL